MENENRFNKDLISKGAKKITEWEYQILTGLVEVYGEKVSIKKSIDLLALLTSDVLEILKEESPTNKDYQEYFLDRLKKFSTCTKRAKKNKGMSETEN